jgi:hypothetical protein
MTVMLTSISDTDPHTIRETWIGMVWMLGVGQFGLYVGLPQWILWYVRCRISRRRAFSLE